MSTEPTSEQLCPVDGTPMRRGVWPLEIAYKGRTLTVEMPGWYCDACGESIHDADDRKAADCALNRLKAEVEGLLRPEDVRRIRKRLGLSQKDAGRVIGGGPYAFQKFESGEMLTSREISNLLRILVRHPQELRLLLKTTPDQPD